MAQQNMERSFGNKSKDLPFLTIPKSHAKMSEALSTPIPLTPASKPPSVCRGSDPPAIPPGSPDPVHDLPQALLDVGWRKFWSKREGRPYFFNKTTNQSLWEMPTLGSGEVSKLYFELT